jgi:hypothetical protein
VQSLRGTSHDDRHLDEAQAFSCRFVGVLLA